MIGNYPTDKPGSKIRRRNLIRFSFLRYSQTFAIVAHREFYICFVKLTNFGRPLPSQSGTLFRIRKNSSISKIVHSSYSVSTKMTKKCGGIMQLELKLGLQNTINDHYFLFLFPLIVICHKNQIRIPTCRSRKITPENVV